MERYALIDLDQMEPTIVRRRLRRWTRADEDAIRPLIESLKKMNGLPGVRIVEPRYETNVYPLYFYWAHRHGVDHARVYDRVCASVPIDSLSDPPEELKAHVGRLADTEIDLLIEDVDYFVFIEAKESSDGGRVKFETRHGVHQLVT